MKKKLFQLQFLSSIAPIFSIASLSLFYLRFGTHFFYPFFLTIAGLFLTAYFKGWGWLLSACTLISLTAYHYFEVPLADRFWFLGVSLSLSIAQLIGWLAIAEMEDLYLSLFQKSRSRLENLWEIDRKLKYQEKQFQRQKEKLGQVQARLTSYQKLVEQRSHAPNCQ